MKIYGKKALYLPLLLIRWLILALLVATLVLGIALFVLSNSSSFTQALFAWIAPQYEISYRHIGGNLYKGVTLEDVRFQNRTLAKEIILRYNPNALLYKELLITKLHIIDGNVEAIQYFIASFGEDNATVERTDTAPPKIGLTIRTDDVKITTLPFEQNGIDIERAEMLAGHLFFDLDAYRMEARGIKGLLVTDLGKVSFKGDLADRVLQIKALEMTGLDTQKLEALSSQQTKSAKENATAPLEPPFDLIHIDKLTATIKPRVFEKVRVSRLSLDAGDIVVVPQPLSIKKGSIVLKSDTDLAQGSFEGRVVDDHLKGKLDLEPKTALYTRYKLPLRKGSIEKIHAKVDADKTRSVVEVTTAARQLLPAQKGAFNLDIDALHSILHYQYETKRLEANTTVLAMTPYTRKLHLTNHLLYDGNLSYSGTLKSKEIKGVDPRLASLMGSLKVDYNGTMQHLSARLDSRYIHGYMNTNDMRHADIHLQNKAVIRLSELVQLPPELNATKIRSFTADAKVDLKNPKDTRPVVAVDSNLLSMDLHGVPGTTPVIEGTLRIPADSLLRSYQPSVKWDQLSPLAVKASLEKEHLQASMRSKALQAAVDYHLKQDRLDAKATLGTLQITAKGSPAKEITFHTEIHSAKRVLKSLKSLYRVEGEMPPIEGSLSMDAKIKQMKALSLTLRSPELIYKPKRGKIQTIKEFSATIQMSETVLELSRYTLLYNKQKFFATKPSKILLKDQRIEVPALWVNDSLKINGEYAPKKAEGTFTAKAQRFHIKDDTADIYAMIDIDTQISGKDTMVKGKVVLLGGTLSPDVAGRSFASDDDIIILQEQKKKEQGSFMEHLTLMLKIEAKKPIIFKQPDTYVRLKPDLTILKDPGGKILYLGSVELLEGGYYRFKEKKFVLKKSYVYFTGDLNKPLLDIKATYQSLKYLITITVTGTPAAPSINFSSSPPLTREQILSVILFDSEEGGDTHSGDEMMRMMGGAMAKAALSDLGVKIDHLVLGENGSIEIGKKLTKKITVIYINGDEPQIKLKYKHGKHTESVIGVSQKSESYDIIYKGDF